MQYRVLGPLEVESVDGSVQLGAQKERLLLAALLVRPNETVTTAQLVSDLWGENPPRTAAKTVQAYVSRLRRTLPDAAIVTIGAGYRLDVDPDDVDAHRFARLGFEGRRALDAGDPMTSARTLDQALGLWRGEPLAEFQEASFAAAEGARLHELRLSIVEDRVSAGLALGEGTRLVAELQRLARAHPLRERFWGQLMVALYQSGRQADALATYQTARRYLVEEAGVEPSDELRALERAVLDQDPSLMAPAPPAAALETTTVTVTVLMTDIESSTRAWEAEPDAMAVAVARHEHVIELSVAEHGGDLLKTKGEGDSTFSVFQRASDAAGAALALQRRLAAEPWPTSSPLRVRAAIHTGEVQARDGNYYGQAVNRAARLRAIATPGEVLLSATSAGLAADSLEPGAELVDCGSQHLRDLARPEHVFALWHPDLGPRPRRAPASTGLSGALRVLVDSPIVGRTQELQRLGARLRSAVDGNPTLVLVAGEPGIGKTRLVAEAASRAAADGSVVVYGRCDEEALSSYQPVVQILSELAPHLTATAVRDAFEDAAELRTLVPALDRLVPREEPGRIQLPTDRLRLFDAVAALLRSIDRPLLVVIDDLHWADESTLQLLCHVTRTLADASVAVVATFRPTELGRAQPLTTALADLSHAVNTERIDLAGLTVHDVARLIESGPHDLAEEVCRVTSGNAFFVVELARELVDGGASVVPHSVKHVVGRRVTRLGDAANQLLVAGAVIGVEFDFGLAAAVAGLDEEVALDAVDVAVRAGLLRTTDNDSVVFAHALVRQTLVDELTPSRRIRMHRRIAETIEAAHPSSSDTWAAALAHHWAAAGDQTPGGPAFAYAMQAGDRAASLMAWEECILHYQRALELAEAAGDIRGQIAALTELGEALLVVAETARADDHLLRAIELAREIGDAELLARGVLSYGTFARSPEGADPIVELLEEALERLGDAHPALRASLLGRLAFSRLFLGRGGPELAREAFDLATETGDPLAIIMAANALRFVAPDALDFDLLAHPAKQLLGTKWAMWAVFAESWKVCAAFDRGDVSTAESGWDDLVERTGGGLPLALGQRGLFRALLGALRGQLDEAEVLIADAGRTLAFGGANTALLTSSVAAAVERIRGRYGSGIHALEALRLVRHDLAAPRLALAYAATGRLDDARREVDAMAEDDFARLDEEWVGTFGLGFVARALATIGDADQARPVYDLLLPRSGALLTLHGFLDCLGSVDFHLGLLAEVMGRRSDAVAHLETALARHEALGFPTLIAETSAVLGRVVVDQDPDRATRLARAALADAERIGMDEVAAVARGVLRRVGRPPLSSSLSTLAPLVGRSDEIERLRRWVRDGPRLALVTGEPGIGKTRLMAELAAEVFGRGDTVLYGTCDDQLNLPFQPWVMATRGLVPPPQPHAGTIDPELERYRWFADVEQALAAQRDVLVVLDDLHWADAGTLALLKHVVHADLPAPVRILGAYRDTDLDRGRPLGRFVAALWRDAPALRIDLHGLNRASVAELLGDARDAERVHAETEGNPLFVTLLASHRDEDSQRLPQGIRDVIGRRLDRLSVATASFLRIAALVGREFELDVTAAAAEASEDAVLVALEEAMAIGLVVEVPDRIDQFAFAHALIARTLADELSTSRRVRVHRRIGELLAARPGVNAGAVAHHLCEAAVAGVVDKALDWARRAADEALGVGAWEEAARWYAAALETLDEVASPRAIRGLVEVELGEALVHCGLAVDARGHIEQAAALARKEGDAELLARAAVALVGSSVRTARAETAEVALLDEALAALGPADSRWRSLLLSTKANWSAYIGDAAEVSAMAEEARSIAQRIDDDDALGRASGVLASMALSRSTAVEAVAQEVLAVSERTGNGVMTSQAHGLLMAAAVLRGDIDEARRRAARATELAVATKVPRARWGSELFAAGVFATLEGDWERAEASAEAALALAQGSTVNPFLPLGVFLSQLIPVRWMQGRLGELADTLAWAADTSDGPLLWYSAAALGLADAGRLDEARAQLDPIRSLEPDAFASSLDSGAMVFHLAGACRTLGETDLARATYAAIRDREDPVCMFMVYLFLGVYEHHRGNLAAAAGWPALARQHLDTAAQQYESLGAPVWAERAREDLTRVERDA